ncbi:NAD(P)H-dependent oxidoreductase [Candidatus Babeliales bacterium]|nr:NAD(P)H-dependent oxidoreductase [Candidatus Babeliales bacterium]
MKLYAIFANDKLNGTTHQLFEQATNCFKNMGYNIDSLNLYDREEDIPFFRHNRQHMENHPFYLENQQRFLQADTLLLVFPLFWYSVPAILKAWLDMINAWAYKYESGMYANPLHNIKKVFIIYAAMQDKEHLTQNLHNPVEHQLAETCKFIGIDQVYTYLVDKVTSLQGTDLEQHLEEIKNFCMKNNL